MQSITRKASKKPSPQEMFTLDMFPPELQIQFFLLLDKQSRSYYAQTCRYLCSIYVTHRKVFEHYKSPFSFLYSEQEEMLEKIKQQEKRIIYVTSPMGTGKTSTMLIVATQIFPQHKTLIIIPPKTFTTWINEFKKYSKCGLKIHSDPQKSDILIYHGKYPHHRDFFDEDEKTNTGNIIYTALGGVVSGQISMPQLTKPDTHKKIKHNIVLTTFALARSALYTQSHLDHLIRDKPLILIDEAHLIAGSSLLKYGFKTICFTANEDLEIPKKIEKLYPNELADIMITPTDVNYDRPKILFKFYNQNPAKIPNYDVWDVVQDNPLQNSIFNWMLGIIKTILEKNNLKKILVLLNTKAETVGKRFFKKIKDKGDGYWEDYTFFAFRNLTSSTLEKFTKHDKAILFATYYSCSEGVNFNMVGNVVLFDFDVLGISKARQVMGRINRRNNPNKLITAYMVNCSHIEKNALLRLNVVSTKKVGVNLIGKKRSDTVLKICKYLAKCIPDFSLYNLCDEEIILLFGVVNEPLEISHTEDYIVPLGSLLSLSNMQ